MAGLRRMLPPLNVLDSGRSRLEKLDYPEAAGREGQGSTQTCLSRSAKRHFSDSLSFDARGLYELPELLDFPTYVFRKRVRRSSYCDSASSRQTVVIVRL